MERIRRRLSARRWVLAAAVGVALAATAGPARAEELHLAGWFHVVWNGGPQFELVDDRGRTITLLVDEQLVRPFGGPRAFNRKRVRIVGEAVGGSAETVKVLSIELEPRHRIP